MTKNGVTLDDCKMIEDTVTIDDNKVTEDNVTLDKIKICRPSQDPDISDDELSPELLTLSVTTWMKLYNNLDTAEYRASMRDVSILIAKTFRKSKDAISEHGTFKNKFALSAPYHLFLSSIAELEFTLAQPYSVTFHEIIDYTGGDIVESLHLNCSVNLLWITTEYMLAAQNPKMTIVCQTVEDPDHALYIPFDIEISLVETPEFGCHHSKISILKYSNDTIRIIIFSGCFYETEWQNRTQGLWISPPLPLLSQTADASEGESVTNFKKDFIQYLNAYKQPEIFGWEALIHRTDFTNINVFFLGSVPGQHGDKHFNTWGINRLGKILSEHVSHSNIKSWPIVAQCSTVGFLGNPISSAGVNNHKDSFLSHIVLAMAKEKSKIVFLPNFKCIYPSQKNYDESYDAINKIKESHLRYNEEVHLKQQWLKTYLYQWKSESLNRTLAIPHMKCYTRISPDETEILWFVMSSHNLSRNGWGKSIDYRNRLCIRNYEAGVVFIPQIIINQSTFPIIKSNSPECPVFLLPYDLPLTPYNPDDEPCLIKSNAVNKNSNSELNAECEVSSELSNLVCTEETKKLDVSEDDKPSLIESNSFNQISHSDQKKIEDQETSKLVVMDKEKMC